FLKNSEHIEALQKQQQALQLEVDDLVARLQGDEAGLESYKTKQLETKQTIDDLQQQLFTTSNAITRLEQNALHAKQRKGQVEQELARISEQHELLNHSIDEAQEALAVSNEALENIEPEFALKEAELEHAKERFEDAEQALREFNAQARAQEQTYNQLRQNVQQCHSQIQSTMSMQLRTSQRISELQDELKQLDEEDFASQITLLEEQCSELYFDIDEAKQLLQESNQKVSQQQGEVNAIEAKRRDVQGQLQTALSTKAALEALQQDASNNEDVLLDGIEKLWQQFSSNQTLAPCVESILQHAKDPVVAKSHDIQALLQNRAYLPSGIKVFTDKAFVSTARVGSLAHALLTESSTNESSTQRVPAFFNDIYLCSNDDELAEMIESAFNNEPEPEG
ncbi:MAG: chromosome segregation protein SMC, partial [Pseudomonadota bacterium]|nr:chromosome segregation protein SMC [Pseudomonadota bacterium]